jgi:hypothetical protein
LGIGRAQDEMTDPTNRYFGAPIRRNEDRRLLTGRALFVDDVSLPDMLHAALLRSPHAHARIAGIDVSAALGRDGVVAVYTAEDLGDFWHTVPLVVPPPPIEDMVFNQHTQVPLAKDKVRHLGEAVALVVAENRYVAEDALNDITVDYEPLPVAADLEKAAASDAPRVHDDVAGNVAAQVHQTKGDYEAAVAQAATVVKRRFTYDHGMAQPMETRGVVAGWDAKVDRLTVWATTQAPASLRNGLAALLGLSEAHVRVIAPFVGGGLARLFRQVDRRPGRAFLRDHPGARTDPRCRDRAFGGRQDPRNQGRVPARHRGLQPLRPDGADQQPMLDPRPLRRAGLRQRLHGGLHQQADRRALPRRGPAARRVRDRTAARYRGARARYRPGGDPPTQLHPAGRLSFQQRDYLPGLHPAAIRQR